MNFLIIDKETRIHEKGFISYEVQSLLNELESRNLKHTFARYADIEIYLEGNEIKIKCLEEDINTFTHIILRGHWTDKENFIKYTIACYVSKYEIKMLNAKFIAKFPFYNKIAHMHFAGENHINYLNTYYQPNQKHLLNKLPLIAKSGFNENEIVRNEQNDLKLKKKIELISSLEELNDLNTNYSAQELIYQEFINIGEDIRVYLINGRYINSYIRKATDSFVTVRKGKYTLYKPDLFFIEFCENISKKFEVDFCGLDIIYKGNQPYLLELNQAPGFKVLETKVSTLQESNLAKQIVDFMID